MDHDSDLIRRVVDRDPGAGTEFVHRYRGLVIGLARGRLGLDHDAAEELLQKTMTRLWDNDHRALRAWRGEGRFSTYLTVIVLRMAGRPSPTVPIGSPIREAPDPRPSPAESADRHARWQAVRSALAKSSPRDRLLLALRYFDGRPPREIAQVLGKRPGAARKNLHDALTRLRRRLRDTAPEWFGEEGP